MTMTRLASKERRDFDRKRNVEAGERMNRIIVSSVRSWFPAHWLIKIGVNSFRVLMTIQAMRHIKGGGNENEPSKYNRRIIIE